MRVFKAKRRTPDGRVVEYGKWYIEVGDHRGRPRRFVGFKDKRLSERMGQRIEALVTALKSGEPIPVDVARWIEAAPVGLREHLCKVGLLEQRQAAAGVGLEDLLQQFLDTLRLRGRTPQYIADVGSRLRTVFDECGFRAWSDCATAKLESFLDAVRASGRSNRSLNHYLVGFKGFQNWLLDRDLITKPLPGLRMLKKFNESLDRRLVRRSLTAEELERLFEAARRRPLEEAGLLNRGPDKGKAGACLLYTSPSPRDRG